MGSSPLIITAIPTWAFLLAIASLNNFFNSPFLSLAMTGSANTSKIERIVLTYLFMEYTVFTRR